MEFLDLIGQITKKNKQPNRVVGCLLRFYVNSIKSKGKRKGLGNGRITYLVHKKDFIGITITRFLQSRLLEKYRFVRKYIRNYICV